jgi:phosphodiesterase/alkaline phosphatase D-like protein
MTVPRNHTELLAALGVTRRRFLTGTGAAAALAVTGTLVGVRPGVSSAEGRESRQLFTLGVASGDPLPDAVVIWTRLAPDPVAPFGGMPDRHVSVQWQVAEDEGFRRVVRHGTATARPELSHAVHVDVRGLRPWRHYFYRFQAMGQLSPVGRTRTAPAPGADITELNLAFASCQQWNTGHYTAHADIARRDHDVVFFLGDYIYETGIPADGGVRRQAVGEDAAREAFTLDDYRAKYALYKLDPNLQAAHAAAPWVPTMDDHEVENNWCGPYSLDLPDPAGFLVRRANAFRAYWEHMPLRLAQLPEGPDMRLYRRLAYGRLAEFSVLDTRQYRSNQVAEGAWVSPDDESRDPSRTITGDVQERWVLDGLAASAARWNVLAQQVLMMPVDRLAGPGAESPMGTWEGYSASRDRVLGGLHERGVRNLVVLTGDVHANFAGDLKLDFAAPQSPTVGAEFVGTSISSEGDGTDIDAWGRTILAEGPHLRFMNHQRGYVSCRVTPSEWTSEYRVADRVSDGEGTMSTRATLTVQDGVPGVQQ